MDAVISKKKKFSRSRLKALVFYVCILAVPVAQFCIFYIGVNINSILLAFKDYNRESNSYYLVGFDNFRKIFYELLHAKVLPNAFRNSLILFVSKSIVGITLALLFSFYIYKKHFGTPVFKVMLFMPSIISSVTMVVMFKYFSERAIPEIVNLAFGIKMEGLISNFKTSFGTLLFYSVWISFGPQVLLYTGAMSGISESVVESAQLDGVKPGREFLSITLPLIYPTVVTFITVGIAQLFIDQMNLFTFFESSADSSLYTVGYYIFKDLRKSATIAEYPYLAAMGVLLTLVAAPLTLGARKILEKVGPSAN